MPTLTITLPNTPAMRYALSYIASQVCHDEAEACAAEDDQAHEGAYRKLAKALDEALSKADDSRELASDEDISRFAGETLDDD